MSNTDDVVGAVYHVELSFDDMMTLKLAVAAEVRECLQQENSNKRFEDSHSQNNAKYWNNRRLKLEEVEKKLESAKHRRSGE